MKNTNSFLQNIARIFAGLQRKRSSRLERRSAVPDQFRERRLRTGQVFRTDGIIDELVTNSGCILRTLNLPGGLNLSLVDENGHDLDLSGSDFKQSDDIVQLRAGDRGTFSIGAQLSTLDLPGGEKILLDQFGIIAVFNGNEKEQMRRKSKTDLAQLISA